MLVAANCIRRFEPWEVAPSAKLLHSLSEMLISFADKLDSTPSNPARIVTKLDDHPARTLVDSPHSLELMSFFLIITLVNA
jgi:hypothetical protein